MIPFSNEVGVREEIEEASINLRYNENANVPGAQTERWGEAVSVSVLLRGWDSPADFRVRYQGLSFINSFASSRKRMSSTLTFAFFSS